MEKSLQHLDFIESNAKDIIYHYNKDSVPLPCFFYLGLLERLHSAAIGLKTLVQKIKEIPEHEFTVGLLIRTTIMDFLIGLRGYDIYKNGEDAGDTIETIDLELKKYCNSTLADGVAKTGRYFVLSNKKGHISDDQLHGVLNKLSSDYSIFIEQYNNDKIAPKSKFDAALNGSALFEKISDATEINKLALHFEKYAMFSKYEHFSMMSYSVMRRPIQDQLPTVEHAIEALVLHLFLCAEIIRCYLNDDFIVQKIDPIVKYIEALLGITEEPVKEEVVK